VGLRVTCLTLVYGDGAAEKVACGAGVGHRVSVVDVEDQSSGADDFKEQIADRLSAFPQLPYGPLRIHISFTIGPSRNWINLWKPTIDSLVPLLGRDPHGATKWSPLDGRITDLALHLKVDRALGSKVQIALAADLIQTTHAEPHYRAHLLALPETMDPRSASLRRPVS